MHKISQQLKTLPDKPGVYLFHNAAGEVLYVGKAKKLRTRVKSYFRPRAALAAAKKQMVEQIANVTTIVVDTEIEALILEATLIRQHRPPYNVVLTDDKYYLFIKITKEDYPRVFPVRRVQTDRARYFGPYSSAAAVRQTLRLLRRLFIHRGEKDKPHDVIFPHPLFSKQEKSAPYQDNINHIIRFLQGRRGEIIAKLRAGMLTAARAKQFEQAGIWRDQLLALERLEGNQKVYLPKKESFDVVSIVTQANVSAANVLQIREGKLLNKNTFLLKSQATATAADILRQFLLQYYRDAQDIPNLILLPGMIGDQKNIAVYIRPEKPPALLVPTRGKKKQLIKMGELNAKQLLREESAAFHQTARLQRATRELALALGIPDNPLTRVETYDISNIQGHLATGSMVVFTAGKPDRGQYRKFKIKLNDDHTNENTSSNANKPNDYAMLQEVIKRRFAAKHNNWPVPNLLLIDGGKGQLSSVRKILSNSNSAVPVAALAKREEILYISQKKKGHTALKEIRLPYDSDALYLVQRMRDEAHRFTISYHRLLRLKKNTRSILDEIPGIGPKTKKRLLARFGSLKNIRAASETELNNLLGAKAKTLRDYL